jgi:hypothetical protein
VQLTLLLLLSAHLAAAIGMEEQESPEELPPPKQEQSVLVKETTPAKEPQFKGFCLVGPSGRHYCLDGTALADYWRLGQRHLVKLEAESPQPSPVDEESFLYFRELNTGHRWAFARQASGDERHRVYLQTADRPGDWQLFQRAQAAWDEEREVLAPVLLWIEPTWEGPLLSPAFLIP